MCIYVCVCVYEYIYFYILTYTYICIHIYIYIHISSSSCRAACADIPDRLSPPLPIIHRLRQVFRVTSRVLT